MGGEESNGSPTIKYQIRDLIDKLEAEQEKMDKRITTLEGSAKTMERLHSAVWKVGLSLVTTGLLGIGAMIVSLIRYGPAIQKLAGGP